MLGPRFRVIAFGLIGCGDAGGWCGLHAFRLIYEIQSIIEIVDELQHPVHLVGHSYGGGVALRVATERPHVRATLVKWWPKAPLDFQALIVGAQTKRHKTLTPSEGAKGRRPGRPVPELILEKIL